ncbi:MAG TPA: glycosyltransferase [Pirellulales bacterium]|nr:glycosyltransferase [Pirellulales bacterium]
MATAVSDETEPSGGVSMAAAPIATRAGCVKVLHVINGDLFAGAERVQDLLALGLGEFGYEPGFACLKPGRFKAQRRAQDAPLVDVPMRFKGDLSPAVRLARLIRREGYELLHTHSPRGAIVGRFASAWTGVPMVHHLHSPAGAEYKQAWRNRLNAFVERASLTSVGAAIAVSESVAQYARSHDLAADRIVVVHNGVPVPGPLPARAVPGPSWTLGVAALFRPRKGLEVLVEALSILRSQGLDVRLRALGSFSDGRYEDHVKSEVARLQVGDAIEWLGFTSDVIGQMRNLDLFILPSLFGEGLPMVVLEAMSAGVPVVATRVEGIPEAVRDGVDGLLAAPGDAQDLARVMARVIQGQVDWSELRRSAYERQGQHFSDRSMAAGVAGVYDALLAG